MVPGAVLPPGDYLIRARYSLLAGVQTTRFPSLWLLLDRSFSANGCPAEVADDHYKEQIGQSRT